MKATPRRKSESKSPPDKRKDEPEELPPPPDRPKIWHEQHARLLKQWADVASIYRWMHYETHQYYARYNFWLTLPTIIISSITGTLNFAQASFPPDYATLLPIGIGTLNLIAGAITTIASFLRVGELAEGNRMAAISFGKLSRNIRTELLMPSGQRTMDGVDFIQMCRVDLDRMTEQTPDIPDHIVAAFNRKFGDVLKSGKFYQPEISVLQPVEIYTDDKEEKEQRIARIMTNVARAFQSTPKTSPVIEPVPAPVVPAMPTFALSPQAAREQVREELQDLSRIGAVSNRISQRFIAKARTAQAQAVAVAAAGQAAGQGQAQTVAGQGQGVVAQVGHAAASATQVAQIVSNTESVINDAAHVVIDVLAAKDAVVVNDGPPREKIE